MLDSDHDHTVKASGEPVKDPKAHAYVDLVNEAPWNIRLFPGHKVHRHGVPFILRGCAGTRRADKRDKRLASKQVHRHSRRRPRLTAVMLPNG